MWFTGPRATPFSSRAPLSVVGNSHRPLSISRRCKRARASTCTVSRKCRSFARSLRESGSISLGGVCGCHLLVGPSHHRAGGVKKYEVADFAACASVILADVLGYPKGNFAVLAHEAQQIALPQEADLGRLLGLGC